MAYRINVDQLKGLALNYVVARCEGEKVSLRGDTLWVAGTGRYDPVQDASRAQAIFQRERIGTVPQESLWVGSIVKGYDRQGHTMVLRVVGDTLSEAGLRAYVKRQKGESVTLPAAIVAAMDLPSPGAPR